VGISSEYLGKIFERFWQLEKTEQEGHSFGLGLYLVKKIVQLHGWKIHVESEVGKGSKFVIEW
jgi:signal transduction histidine kinase